MIGRLERLRLETVSKQVKTLPEGIWLVVLRMLGSDHDRTYRPHKAGFLIRWPGLRQPQTFTSFHSCCPSISNTAYLYTISPIAHADTSVGTIDHNIHKLRSRYTVSRRAMPERKGDISFVRNALLSQIRCAIA